MQRADIDRVANIWLDTNIRAHNFISKQYWKQIFPQYTYHSILQNLGFHFFPHTRISLTVKAFLSLY